ncbi:MAG: hypothetical protein IJZ84_05125 [Lachnospiraceae bacterium]|nr:hypothetical protein [Lachnospiraceae bacterium]
MEQKAKKSLSKVNSGKSSDIRKLKLLVTIVNRSKETYYIDLLEQFEVNMQVVLYGSGTANSEMLNMLGLAETEKAIILSCVREDRVEEIKHALDEKFHKIRNGKGIAYTIPLQSVVGVAIYQFLSNYQTTRTEAN